MKETRKIQINKQKRTGKKKEGKIEDKPPLWEVKVQKWISIFIISPSFLMGLFFRPRTGPYQTKSKNAGLLSFFFFIYNPK